MEAAFGIFAILAIAGFAFWIWALVDAVKVPDDSMFRAGNKLVWVLLIVLTGWIGAIIYVVVGRPAAVAQPHHTHSFSPPPPPTRPD